MPLKFHIDLEERKFINYLLLPLTGIFYILSVIRRILYQLDIFKSYTSKKPIIVVGNITIGGTGKTPIVIEIVKFLQEKNKKVGVISRGYGRSNTNLIVVGNKSISQECGDEPLLIYNKTNCLVAISNNKINAIKAIEDKVDVIISDDGLQNYSFKHSIEIVVFAGMGNGFYLPAGKLREGAFRLKTVDFILNKNNFKVENIAFINAKTGVSKALDFFKGNEVVAICGIARPKRFFNSLAELGIVFQQKFFPDHHIFTEKDLNYNQQIITTAKDWVKYKSFATDNMWYLDIIIKIDNSFYINLDNKLNQIINNA